MSRGGRDQPQKRFEVLQRLHSSPRTEVDTFALHSAVPLLPAWGGESTPTTVRAVAADGSMGTPGLVLRKSKCISLREMICFIQ